MPLLQGVKTQPRQPPNSINVLTSRLLNVPLYRQWYANKLRELLARSFMSDQLQARIAALHEAIAAEAQRDVYKRYREDNAAFDASPAALQSFVTKRIDFINANLGGVTPGVAQPLLINELVVVNRNGITTGAGQHSPWLELYNPGAQPYSLTGHSLSNDPLRPALWAFPAGTLVPAGGYLLVWLDNQPAPGELHTSFTISPRGQSIGLYAPAAGNSGMTMLDMIGYRALPADQAWGRRASGSALWARQAWPTPMGANSGPP
jgi:hypothetical protein